MTDDTALTTRVLAVASRHAEQAAPDESCGIVLSDGAYLPGLNIQGDLHHADASAHPRTSRDAYTLDPATAMLLAFPRPGDAPIAVLHSHPNGRAYLSARDRLAAVEGGQAIFPVAQVVLAVTAGGEALEAVEYRFSEEQRSFIEVARALRTESGWSRHPASPVDARVRLFPGNGTSDVTVLACTVDDAVAAALAARPEAVAGVLDTTTGALRADVVVELDGLPVRPGARLAEPARVVVRLARQVSHRPATDLHATFSPTPLIDVSGLFEQPGCRVLLKYEPATPTGSHKYRAARAAMAEARRAGSLSPGQSVLAPTGGNYGLALAALTATGGEHCTLVVPDNYPASKIRLLQCAGATVVLADHQLGANAHGLLATEILWSDPDRYCLFDQFSDPANVAGHVPTAHEMLDVLDGLRVDCFVGGIGSGASLTGIAGTLREFMVDLRVVGVQPEGCNVLTGECVPDHGIPGLAVGGPPANLDASVVSSMATVSHREAAATAVRALTMVGLNVGISTGANLAAVGQVLKEGPSPRAIITLAYDRLDSYLDSLP